MIPTPQEVMVARLRRQAEDNLRADREAQAEYVRLERERVADLARCTETAKAMLTGGKSLMGIADDAPDDIDPTDEEIVDVLMETFGMSKEAVVMRICRLTAKFEGEAVDGEQQAADDYNEQW